MNRGTLGEESVDCTESSFDHNTRRSINKSYNRTTSGQVADEDRGTRTITGAARRKKKNPRRQTKALKEIRKLQNSTKLLIPKLPFARLVREISLEVNQEITRYTHVAFEALQEATEIYITQVLEDAYRLTLHRKCVTLSRADIMLLKMLKLCS